MKYPKDLTGMKFGKLTVIEKAGYKNRNSQWLCECECGNTTVVGKGRLTSGTTKSCGCLKHRPAVNRTHGKSKTRLYYVWRNMMNRCYNDKVSDYYNYGGRGIKMCDEWLGKDGFQNFHDWAMANGYDPEAKRGVTTLDRIDSDGNYEPSNCRWVDGKAQANNKRCNHYVHYNGKTMSLKELAESTGINYKTLYNRVHVLNWDIETAVNTPVRNYNYNICKEKNGA